MEKIIIDSTIAIDGFEYIVSRLGMPRCDVEEITTQVLDLMLDDYEFFYSNLQTLPDLNRIVVVPTDKDLEKLKLAVVTLGNTLYDVIKTTGITPVLDEKGIKILPATFGGFLGNDIVLNYLHNV